MFAHVWRVKFIVFALISALVLSLAFGWYVYSSNARGDHLGANFETAVLKKMKIKKQKGRAIDKTSEEDLRTKSLAKKKKKNKKSSSKNNKATKDFQKQLKKQLEERRARLQKAINGSTTPF